MRTSVPNVDLRPDHWTIVRSALRRHVPDREVLAFGSRATWTAKDYSDLDLAVMGEEPLPLRTASALDEALGGSDLPFKVDVVDWARIDDAFRAIIRRHSVSVQVPTVIPAVTGRMRVPSATELAAAPLSCAWRKVAIGEIADIVGGGTPSTKNVRNFGGSIPWLTPRDLSGTHDRYVEHGERNLSQRGLDSSSAKLLPVGTVLLSTRAPIGYVALAKNPIATNQGFRSLVVRDGILPEFLYYWLKLNTEELERHASGSTFRELSGSALKDIRLDLPPNDGQYAIAHILGTLDDKIELNRRMNETLEAMARALFKSWFVDFDPVRANMEGRNTELPDNIADLFPDRMVDTEMGEIPEGWHPRTLADLARLNPESWSGRNAPDSVRYVDLANTKWGYINDIREFTWESAPSRARRILRRGDTIVGTVRPRNGSFALIDQDGLTGSTAFAVLRPTKPNERELVWCAATSQSAIERLGHLADGGAYPAVRPRAVLDTTVALPDAQVRPAFSSLAAPLVDRMGATQRESRTLAALRDTLLPKLISGEIRVPDAERALASVP